MQQEFVPLISSSVCGPLGVLHLPRLWQKILLHVAGRLPEGYRHGVGGFDEFLCTSLGVDRDAFIHYVESKKPGYLEVEAWVRANATNLTPETIAAFNHEVSTRNLPDAMLTQRCSDVGIPVGSISRAIPLNDLDDWQAFHRSITQK
ncbi:MAG TPA: DUF5069 domain-containing protein [Candidatus Aquilonibacter sp.]